MTIISSGVHRAKWDKQGWTEPCHAATQLPSKSNTKVISTNGMLLTLQGSQPANADGLYIKNIPIKTAFPSRFVVAGGLLLYITCLLFASVKSFHHS